jgi:hypothetical protein
VSAVDGLGCSAGFFEVTLKAACRARLAGRCCVPDSISLCDAVAQWSE